MVFKEIIVKNEKNNEEIIQYEDFRKRYNDLSEFINQHEKTVKILETVGINILLVSFVAGVGAMCFQNLPLAITAVPLMLGGITAHSISGIKSSNEVMENLKIVSVLKQPHYDISDKEKVKLYETVGEIFNIEQEKLDEQFTLDSKFEDYLTYKQDMINAYNEAKGEEIYLDEDDCSDVLDYSISLDGDNLTITNFNNFPPVSNIEFASTFNKKEKLENILGKFPSLENATCSNDYVRGYQVQNLVNLLNLRKQQLNEEYHNESQNIYTSSLEEDYDRIEGITNNKVFAYSKGFKKRNNNKSI